MSAKPPLRVGVAGLGTVGCGTLALLLENGETVASRAGRAIEVTAVCARDPSRPRPIPIDRLRWHDDPVDLALSDDVDVVCELIGGESGPAVTLTETALGAGKPVVTANKALLAHQGERLAKLAEQNDTVLAFEAAVAGGIPIVKALREGLAGNRILRVTGILNGTCNYILTTMRQSGRAFHDVLKEAQDLGYAEAEPSLDVDGEDAAHKLALLAAIAFGVRPSFDSIHMEGIRHVSSEDIAFAEELGYRIKLLGVARLTEAGLEQRLSPCMVRADASIAAVEGVFNAVLVDGDRVGTAVFQGRGAGAEPTASAVVADLIDLARGLRCPTFGVPVDQLVHPTIAPLAEHVGAYYLRLTVVDRPGVLADVAAILRDEEISVESMIQRHRHSDEPVPIVLTTHVTDEAALRRATARIGALDSVREPPRTMRIEAG